MTEYETDGGTVAAKRALRAAVWARRGARPEAERAALAAELAVRLLALPELADATAGGQAVAAYASYGGEPGTVPLLGRLVAAGVPVVLPRLLPGGALAWVRYEGPATLVVSPRGIPEPAGDALGVGADGLLAARVAVVLVPATAVSPGGRRLGQGLGCYDRVLAALAPAAAGGPLLVAVVHDDEVLPDRDVPVEAHDRRVDVVVTPTRTLRVTPPAAGG